MAKKRLQIYYSGMVQGVGFRFMAERIANSLGVTGWVKNLRDGRVEAMCEGDEANLKKFAENVKMSMHNYISGEDASWLDPSGEFEDFQIRLY
ncbi:acylphosphatase [Candidatus Omnitrophota bacterium]